MSIVEEEIPPLVAGDFLSREEFLHRWEAMPDLKEAELIRGVVYLRWRVSVERGDMKSNCWRVARHICCGHTRLQGEFKCHLVDA